MRRTTVIRASAGAAALLLTLATAWGIKITLFMDTDTFIDRAKDILIADVVSIPAGGGDMFDDGLYPVDIEIVMILKGDKTTGKARLATIYPAEAGKRYMVSSLGGLAFGTDLLAVPELSLVPLPSHLKLADLDGKPLKEQVTLVFQRRLAEVKATQNRLQQERLLLEKALDQKAATPAPTTAPATH